MNSHPAPDRVFAQLGQIVLGDQPLLDILNRVVHLAAQLLPSDCQASITLITGDKPATPAFSSGVAIALDERQYAEEAGPCLASAQAGQVVLVPETADECRWPGYAKDAARHGIRSSLSVPLPIQRNVTGALNLYAREFGGFDAAAIDLAETFAGHAAVALANAQLYETTAALADQMKQAMASRAVIEQAKGIVMRDRGCTPDEAFDALVELSQTSHLKLRVVAEQLVNQVVGR